ncbi:MAG: hypothetical protein WDA75_15325 [Candidatus Latescibacterota bacterium]|jgi:uncharacterized Zn finger protein
MAWWYQRFPQASVAEQRQRAAAAAAKLKKRGKALSPVGAQGQAIAQSFWGRAWCANLESYSDYANRLPRGRTYLRSGAVVHLEIDQGRIEALVSGRSLYQVKVEISPAAPTQWRALCRECAGNIGSLVELLQGTLSERIMEIMTRRQTGLFPSPQEITLACSCPDWATMCKHVAAVLYGVGARLDEDPALLFKLRHVDHRELVNQADAVSALTDRRQGKTTPTLSVEEVGEVFGIEVTTGPVVRTRRSKPKQKAATAAKTKKRSAARRGTRGRPAPKKQAPRTRAKKAVTKKAVTRKAVTKKAATKKAATKKVSRALSPKKPVGKTKVHPRTATSKPRGQGARRKAVPPAPSPSPRKGRSRGQSQASDGPMP